MWNEEGYRIRVAGPGASMQVAVLLREVAGNHGTLLDAPGKGGALFRLNPRNYVSNIDFRLEEEEKRGQHFVAIVPRTRQKLWFIIIALIAAIPLAFTLIGLIVLIGGAFFLRHLASQLARKICADTESEYRDELEFQAKPAPA